MDRAHHRRSTVLGIAIALFTRFAAAQTRSPQLDPALQDPVFSQTIRDNRASITVPVRMAFSSVAPSAEMSFEPNPADAITLELTRDHAGVYRLVDDVAVLLRAQCPVIPSWASIARRTSIGRSVACRVLYGDPVHEVATRAAQTLATQGRTVDTAAIERDLARIPAGLRLSSAMIVPPSEWSGGVAFDPIRLEQMEATAPNVSGSAQCLAFRSRWPLSGARWDEANRLVSTHPAADAPSARSRCWGPRGEWALGINDRSGRIALDEPDDHGSTGFYRFEVHAELAHWSARGALTTLRVDSGRPEQLAMIAAHDLDGDGHSEALIVRTVARGTLVEIYSAPDGTIAPWSNGPTVIHSVADVNNDAVLEVLAPYPPTVERRRPSDAPLIELWQRVEGGRFSNRTALSRAFAAQQCRAIPRTIVSAPRATAVELINNVRCARLRGLSAEETVYRLCAAPEGVCESGAGTAAIEAAREDVPYQL